MSSEIIRGVAWVVFLGLTVLGFFSLWVFLTWIGVMALRDKEARGMGVVLLWIIALTTSLVIWGLAGGVR